MPVNEVSYFQVVCDCCEEVCDFGDYSAMATRDDAIDAMDGAGWVVVNGEYLCDDCWMWPSDADDYDEDEYMGPDDPIRRHDYCGGPSVLVLSCRAVHPETRQPCVEKGPHEVHCADQEYGPDWRMTPQGVLAA